MWVSIITSPSCAMRIQKISKLQLDDIWIFFSLLKLNKRDENISMINNVLNQVQFCT